MKACMEFGAGSPDANEGMRGHIWPSNSIFVFDSLGELPFDTQEEKGGDGTPGMEPRSVVWVCT